jgi:hypothetical protein
MLKNLNTFEKKFIGAILAVAIPVWTGMAICLYQEHKTTNSTETTLYEPVINNLEKNLSNVLPQSSNTAWESSIYRTTSTTSKTIPSY